MSQMNVLPVDNMQVSDISPVNSDSTLGAWNEGSAKFADFISQHQQDNSGKNNPKGGKKTEQSIASEANSQQSVNKVKNESKEGEINVEVNSTDEENSSTYENKIQAVKSLNDNREKTLASELSDDTNTKENIAEQIDKQAVIQKDPTEVNDNTDYLKLLALLEAADNVSTENKPTQIDRFSSSNEAKSTKVEAELEVGVAKDESTESKRFSDEEEGKSIIENKTIVLLNKENQKVITEVNNTEASIKINGKSTTEAQVKLAQINTGVDQEQIVSTGTKNVISNTSNNKLVEAIEKIDKTKLTEIQSADIAIEESEIPDDIAANKALELTSVKDLTSIKNTIKGDKNLENKSLTFGSNTTDERLLNTQKISEKSNDSISIEAKVDSVPAAVKSIDINKESNVSNQQAIKDNNSASERLTVGQQSSQSHQENKDSSAQEQRNDQVAKVNTKEAMESDARQVASENKRTEQETVAVKNLLSMGAAKEPVVFKPVEITPHANINTASFSPTEEQAAAHIIEKTASDAIDAMSQKKTVNLHNETIAIYRKDFSVAVKDKVMVMINQKLQQVEIRLDPPELGSMHVKVNMQNEQAVVTFMVQNQQAKEALDQNMGKLRDMLSQSGVDVGDANVEQQQQQTRNENGQSSRDQQAGEGAFIELDDPQGQLANTNLYKASATGVDYYA